MCGGKHDCSEIRSQLQNVVASGFWIEDDSIEFLYFYDHRFPLLVRWWGRMRGLRQFATAHHGVLYGRAEARGG